SPRPIVVAMVSGSQAQQAVPAIGTLPDAVDQHTGRLDAVANSGNETTLNRIPSMGIANEPANVFAAAPPVPATQTPSRRTRDGQPILPIAERSPSMTHSVAELPRDVNLFFGVIPWGQDQRSCCLFLSQALRGNAKAAAAVGTGPSSASRPRQRDKRPSSGGRGNARGDRCGHQPGRGGGIKPQSLTADQERELTRFYNRYGRQLTRGDLRDLRQEAG
ncbi:hypothetical protein VaNZ11_003368, partial [Volvox africanus]